MCAFHLPVWNMERQGKGTQQGLGGSTLPKDRAALNQIAFNSSRQLKALCAKIEDRGVLSKGSDRPKCFSIGEYFVRILSNTVQAQLSKTLVMPVRGTIGPTH